MKRTTLIGALIASLAVGSAAVAGEHERHDGGRGYERHDERGYGHRYEDRGYEHRGDGYAYRHDDRGYGRRYDDRAYGYRYDYRPQPYLGYRAPERYGYGAYYRPHDYYEHRWARGERLPVDYYASPYVIDDYAAFGLYGPPRGCRWVRVDGDAVLAAVATGIVLDTVIHAFH